MQNELQSSIKIPVAVKKRVVKRKHSIAFPVALLLVVFVPFYYLYVDLTQSVDSILTGAFIIALTAIIDIFILLTIACCKKKVERANKILFLLFLCFAFISFCVNGFSGIHRILMLVMLLLCMWLFAHEPITFKECKTLFKIYLVSVICILFNTATGNENAAALGKINSNSGGFLLAILFCISLDFMFKEKRKKKYFYMLLCVWSFAMQFVYDSRTALFGIIAFVMLCVLSKFFKRRIKYKTVFFAMALLAVLGVLIAYYYAEVLYPSLSHGQVRLLGKDLFTGRQTIWRFAFESIKSNLWFGVGSHLNEQQFHEGYYELIMNAHNQPLGTLAALGIFGFVFFYLLLAYNVARLYKRNSQMRFNNYPAIFMFAIMFMSWFDIYFMALYNLLPIIVSFSIITGIGRKDIRSRKA